MDPTETTVLGDNLDLTSEPQTPDLTPIPYASGIEEQTPEEAEDMSKFTEETTPTLTPEEQKQLNHNFLVAIRAGASKEDIEALITVGADVNAVDHYDKTALMEVASGGNTETLILLMKAGADVNAVDKYDRTAFMHAVISGHTESLNVFINAGADVNAPDRHGYTLLMRAAWYGQPEIIEALIKARAKVDAVRG
jgi:ankyrin repeat protein